MFYIFRSIWTCLCLWTSFLQISQTPAALPAPQGKTLCSLMTPVLMSPACPNSPHIPTVEWRLKSAELLHLPPVTLQCAAGWTQLMNSWRQCFATQHTTELKRLGWTSHNDTACFTQLEENKPAVH